MREKERRKNEKKKFTAVFISNIFMWPLISPIKPLNAIILKQCEYMTVLRFILPIKMLTAIHAIG